MTVTTPAWDEISPVRGGFPRMAIDDGVWAQRLASDRERATRNQTADLLVVSAEIEERSRELGAEALILSGSTARARRTRVSDLDFHVIGARPRTDDLPEDIDLYTDTAHSFEAKLRTGDDFAHWSVWYGCVLFDSGVVRVGAATIASLDLWPDPVRKLRQARPVLDFASKLLATGDYHAALEQVRAALSLVARWWLLKHDVFPLARDELSGQLSELGSMQLATDLHSCIHARPQPRELRSMIERARAFVGITGAHAPAVATPGDVPAGSRLTGGY